jgi:hypothetical protein
LSKGKEEFSRHSAKMAFAAGFTTTTALRFPSPPSHVSSPFSDALSEFVQEFGKKRKPSFVQEYMSGAVVNANDVQTALKAMEENSSHRKVRGFLEPIVQAMVDYTGVLDTLCWSSKPSPSKMYLISRLQAKQIRRQRQWYGGACERSLGYEKTQI